MDEGIRVTATNPLQPQQHRKIYKVAVVETLRQVVAVPAFDEAEAHRRVSDAWQAGEFTLGGRDFDGAEFHVLGEATDAEAEELDRIDKDASGDRIWPVARQEKA